jgi:hypothetical protein
LEYYGVIKDMHKFKNYSNKCVYLYSDRYNANLYFFFENYKDGYIDMIKTLNTACNNGSIVYNHIAFNHIEIDKILSLYDEIGSKIMIYIDNIIGHKKMYMGCTIEDINNGTYKYFSRYKPKLGMSS